MANDNETNSKAAALTAKYVASMQAELEGVNSKIAEIRAGELSVLEAERDELSAAIARATGQRGGARRTGRAASEPSTARRTRVPGRLQQFLGYIAEHPGSTVREVAEALEVEPNFLYRLRKEGEQKGELKKVDGWIFPAAMTDEAINEVIKQKQDVAAAA